MQSYNCHHCKDKCPKMSFHFNTLVLFCILHVFLLTRSTDELVTLCHSCYNPGQNYLRKCFHECALPSATKLFPNQQLCVKETPLPQFKVASYKSLGIRLSFKDPATPLLGGGGLGKIGGLRSLVIMPPKYAIFSTLLSKIVAVSY